MALHPLSIQCVFGFREGVKFFQILDDNIKQVYSDNIKQVLAVSYSEGGHLVAVGNQHHITLYDSNSYQVVH